MPRYPSYSVAPAAGVAVVFIMLMFSATILVGFAGTAPDISVRVQPTWKIGQMGYVVFGITNHWWTRSIVVVAVYITIGQINGFATSLLPSPIVVSGVLGNANANTTVLPLTLPSGFSFFGAQPYIVTVYYSQSKFLTLGSDLLQFSYDGTITISY